MASGSNAPFSGEFVDLENVPKLPEGISAEQIFEQNSDVVRQVAEARHQAGLSQVNADGGFFDAYVNESKVSSKTNTAVDPGSNGFVRLGELLTGNAQTESNNKNIVNAAFDFVKLNPNKKCIITNITFTVGRDANPGTLKIRDSNFNTILTRDLGSFNADTEFTESFEQSDYSEFMQKGEDYDVVVVNPAGQITVFEESVNISGNVSDFSFTPQGGSITVQELNQAKNGTVTGQQFTFTDSQGNAFSPSKVGLFPDQNLNGQSINYDLTDSSGNIVKTFNQSDLNQLIDVSTTDTTFQVEANLSGDGTATPELEFLDVRGV